MTDSDQRWGRVEQLFHEALEVEAPERDAFLARRSGSDTALADDVRELLAAHLGSGGFDRLVDSLGGALGRSREDAVAGTRIGPYALVEEIGRGGMGAVYLARRADGQFEQQVALKLHHAGVATDDVRRRFLAERQILARIAHPNIARLLDGGITEDGRSYFVMEYVDGLPIDRYCDAHRLDVPARLRMFLGACEAVRYAHRNLVVHRDLKPGNILVTADGTVKLLDFGIAKLLDASESAEPMDVTRPGVRLLTPDCASPEQVLGEPVTTASDVYQLGVLLFELLTGTKPYRVQSRSIAELERVVAHLPRLPPSDAVRETPHAAPAAAERAAARSTTPDRLRRRLAGDLDTIVLTAMRREPDRRYASAGDLAEDVQRHLDGRPVRARPDTWWYRSGKFVRRNRAAVGAVAVVFALVVGFAVAMARQAHKTALALTRAERVTEFLVGLFQASSPEFTRGDTLTVREVLDRGAVRARAELEDEPELRALLMSVIAQVYEHLQVTDQALALRREVLATRRAALGDEDPALAQAFVQLALLTARAGAPDDARPLLEESERRTRAARLPDGELAAQLNNVGNGWQVLGELDRAEPLLEEALARHARLPRPREDRVATLTNLGNIRLARGDADSAEVLLRAGLAIRRRLYDPGDSRIATSLANLAGALIRSGRLAEADSAAAEAIRIRRAIYPGGHIALHRLVWIRAGIRRSMGELDAAEALYREALDGYLAALGENAMQVPLIRNDLAVVFKERGNLAEAEALYREALAGFEARYGTDHVNTAIARTNLAWVIAQQGRLAEADRLYAAAVGGFRRTRGRHPSLAGVLLDWGTVRLAAGDAARAVPLLEEGLDIQLEAVGESGWETIRARNTLGRALTRLQRFNEAETQLLAAAHAAGGDSTLLGFTTPLLASLYEAWGRPEAAERYRRGVGAGH